QPKYAVDWLIERYQKQLDIGSAQGKRQFSDIVLGVVRGLTDQVEQEHYIEKVGGIIGVSKDALLAKLNKKPEVVVRLKPKKAANRLPDKTALELIKIENHLLALALLQPKLRECLANIKPQMLAEEQAAKL